MTTPLLSILIPTIVDRRSQYAKLRNEINRQRMEFNLMDLVHVDFLEDNRQMTIGEKRERLYADAKGKYSVQWDDDDGILMNGLELIVEALEYNPDCLTYQEYVNIDGVEYLSNHSLAYNDWEGDGQSEFADGFHFHRTPFMKSVIRTDIAKAVPIQHIRFGEDHQFARDLKSHLTNEIHLDHEVYRYIHVSSNFNERYGVK
jgi:hypothetical protein